MRFFKRQPKIQPRTQTNDQRVLQEIIDADPALFLQAIIASTPTYFLEAIAEALEEKGEVELATYIRTTKLQPKTKRTKRARKGRPTG